MDVLSNQPLPGQPLESRVVSGPGAKLAADREPIGSEASELVNLPNLLQTKWASFLSNYSWQIFATFTFKDETHPEAADKAFRHWAKLVDHSNGWRHRSKSTYARRMIWARGLEWQKRGVIHFHSLIGNLPYERTSQVQRTLMGKQWFDMKNTGFAKVDLYDGRTSAAEYITKYCAKGGEVDLSPSLKLPDLVGIVER